MGTENLKTEGSSTIVGNETAEQLLQKIITEGARPGEIDKQELQALLESKALEVADIKSETKEALTKLKKEGLKRILENGLTLSKTDASILTAMKEQGYTLSPEVETRLQSGESFTVTVGKYYTIVLESSLSVGWNDNRANITDIVGNTQKEEVSTSNLVSSQEEETPVTTHDAVKTPTIRTPTELEIKNKNFDDKRKADALGGISMEEASSTTEIDNARYAFRSKAERLGHIAYLSTKDPTIIQQAGFADINTLNQAQKNASFEFSNHFQAMSNFQAINGQSEESMKITDLKDGTLSRYVFKTEGARKQYLKDHKLDATTVVSTPVKSDVVVAKTEVTPVKQAESLKNNVSPADIMAANQQAESLKNTAVELFKTKNPTLADMIITNQTTITDAVKILEDARNTLGNTPADVKQKKTMTDLISQLMSTSKTEEIRRKNSKYVSETENKAHEVTVFKNLYNINQEILALGLGSSKPTEISTPVISPLVEEPTMTIIPEEAAEVLIDIPMEGAETSPQPEVSSVTKAVEKLPEVDIFTKLSTALNNLNTYKEDAKNTTITMTISRNVDEIINTLRNGANINDDNLQHAMNLLIEGNIRGFQAIIKRPQDGVVGCGDMLKFFYAAGVRNENVPSNITPLQASKEAEYIGGVKKIDLLAKKESVPDLAPSSEKTNLAKLEEIRPELVPSTPHVSATPKVAETSHDPLDHKKGETAEAYLLRQ